MSPENSQAALTLARAAFNPACDRSWINLRSNCAWMAKILKTISPEVAVVLMPTSLIDQKSTPLLFRFSMSSMRCLRDLPSRSSLQITRVSPACSSCMQLSKPGRSDFAPLALSMKMSFSGTPAFFSASICEPLPKNRTAGFIENKQQNQPSS